MNTWNGKNIGKLKKLEEGDVVIFPRDKVRYKVATKYLRNPLGKNDEIFNRYKVDACAMCRAIYGQVNVYGEWPEPTSNHMKNLTAVVKAIFRIAKTGKVPREFSAKAKQLAAASAEREKERKAAAKMIAFKASIKHLPASARRVAVYLRANPDAFGCQRGHVTAIVSALVGHDLAGLVTKAH